MLRSGKIWGQTEQIIANSSLEFHRIEVKKGGKCSIHCHEFKFNFFYVETGKLLIRTWKQNYDLIDETILEAGDYTEVKPPEYHQFEALEDTIAFEIYFAHFSHDDIKRKSVGSIEN